MSDRERWIVYPLLLFAILMAAKSRLPLPHDLDCRSIRCREILVTADDGSGRIHLQGSPGPAGQLRLYGAANQPLLVLGSDPSGRWGLAEWGSGGPRPQAVIGSDEDGGFARLSGPTEGPSLLVGYDAAGGVCGLWAVNDQNKPLVISHQDRPVLWGLQLPLPQQRRALQPPAPAGQPSPASESPASQSPASQSPASQSPASQSPASPSPASPSPASPSPASPSPASQSPASQSVPPGDASAPAPDPRQ